MVLHEIANLGPPGLPGSIPGVGVQKEVYENELQKNQILHLGDYNTCVFVNILIFK